MVRSAFIQTEDYSLATMAEKILGRTKLIEKSGREKVAEITHLFQTDKTSLADYNLEDARLVYEIFEKLHLSQLAVRRAQLTGLAVDRVGGSVAAFDFLYLPLLHRRGYAAATNAQPAFLSETFSREFIEKEGYQVIYGDTDSLFIDFGDGEQTAIKQVGAQLSAQLNDYLNAELRQRFSVASQLHIEFEKLFAHFFMPTIRGRNTGSKKRYAGLFYNEGGAAELYFAGMETTRRDWTALAKEFQVDLFALLFKQSDTPDLKDALGDLVRSRHQALYDGRLDDKLVYQKGISKRLEDYTKNVPPHVRAARMLDHFEGRIVSYVMTTDGPEPVQKRSRAAYDYAHYSHKQLAPIADMVLRFFDLDYHSLITGGKQLNLF